MRLSPSSKLVFLRIVFLNCAYLLNAFRPVSRGRRRRRRRRTNSQIWSSPHSITLMDGISPSASPHSDLVCSFIKVRVYSSKRCSFICVLVSIRNDRCRCCAIRNKTNTHTCKFPNRFEKVYLLSNMTGFSNRHARLLRILLLARLLISLIF